MAKTPQFTIETTFPALAGELPPALARTLSSLQVGDVSASLYRCTPAFRIPRRRLRHDLLLLPLEGRGLAVLDGRRVPLQPRRLVAAARGTWLAAETDAQRPLRLILLAHRADCVGGVPLSVATGLPPVLPVRPDDGLEETLLACCREDALRAPGYRPALEALTTRLLIDLVRRHGPALRAPETGALAQMARLAPALSVMGQDLSLPLRMRELALACGLSAPQFRRVFRAALGTSPVGHLQSLRIAEARRLLTGTDLPVAEIAARVGYRSTACLDRLFRKELGRSPGAWREVSARARSRSRP